MVIICVDKAGGVAFAFFLGIIMSLAFYYHEGRVEEIVFVVRAVVETPWYTKYKCHLFNFP